MDEAKSSKFDIKGYICYLYEACSKRRNKQHSGRRLSIGIMTELQPEETYKWN